MVRLDSTHLLRILVGVQALCAARVGWLDLCASELGKI